MRRRTQRPSAQSLSTGSDWCGCGAMHLRLARTTPADLRPATQWSPATRTGSDQARWYSSVVP
eukprot:6461613-Amphidinium_carterae.1